MYYIKTVNLFLEIATNLIDWELIRMSLPVNGWLHYINREKPSHDSVYRRRIDLNCQNALEEDLGHGFKRYTWIPAVRINNGEYLDFRLEAQKNEHVVSAGYLSAPIANIYSIQNGPSDPNAMIVILHNASDIHSDVSLWLVVKNNG
ncbi:hypothetical protein V7139_07490 [Neobacillus drentensis]|uniref:hypothetical protein n=1 Tax=Neobacillus drentensis TaxID=220684 RepID=UPI003001B312